MGEQAITADDEERIREYLERPADARRIEDLIPDDEESSD